MSGDEAADQLEVDDRQGSLSSRRPKTPRCEGGHSPGPSPNARSRKIRKGQRDKDDEEGGSLTLPCPHVVRLSEVRQICCQQL